MRRFIYLYSLLFLGACEAASTEELTGQQADGGIVDTRFNGEDSGILMDTGTLPIPDGGVLVNGEIYPPQLKAGKVCQGQTLQFTGVRMEPPLQWTITGLPFLAEESTTERTRSYSFTPTASGNYLIEVRVRDARGAELSKTYNYLVKATDQEQYVFFATQRGPNYRFYAKNLCEAPNLPPTLITTKPRARSTVRISADRKIVAIVGDQDSWVDFRSGEPRYIEGGPQSMTAYDVNTYRLPEAYEVQNRELYYWSDLEAAPKRVLLSSQDIVHVTHSRFSEDFAALSKTEDGQGYQLVFGDSEGPSGAILKSSNSTENSFGSFAFTQAPFGALVFDRTPADGWQMGWFGLESSRPVQWSSLPPVRQLLYAPSGRFLTMSLVDNLVFPKLLSAALLEDGSLDLEVIPRGLTPEETICSTFVPNNQQNYAFLTGTSDCQRPSHLHLYYRSARGRLVDIGPGIFANRSDLNPNALMVNEQGLVVIGSSQHPTIEVFNMRNPGQRAALRISGAARIKSFRTSQQDQRWIFIEAVDAAGKTTALYSMDSFQWPPRLGRNYWGLHAEAKFAHGTEVKVSADGQRVLFAHHSGVENSNRFVVFKHSGPGVANSQVFGPFEFSGPRLPTIF